MFSENNSCSELGSQGICKETRGIVEVLDIAFVTSVEEDWPLLEFIIGIVKDVSHIEMSVHGSLSSRIEPVKWHFKLGREWRILSWIFSSMLVNYIEDSSWCEFGCDSKNLENGEECNKHCHFPL